MILYNQRKQELVILAILLTRPGGLDIFIYLQLARGSIGLGTVRVGFMWHKSVVVPAAGTSNKSDFSLTAAIPCATSHAATDDGTS